MLRALLAVIVFSAVIFIHESGHFLAFRAFNVPVEEFTVGLGPVIWKGRAAGANFTVRALPVLGYIKIAPQPLRESSLVVRFLAMLSGMLFNVVSAFLVLIPLMKESAARRVFLAFKISFGSWLATPWLIFKTGGKFLEYVMGPVGIFQVVTGVMRRRGLEKGALSTFIFLSLGVAGFNLLPLFPLDGGQMVLAALERVSPLIALIYASLSLTALLALAGMIFWQDIKKFRERKRFPFKK